jgi:regulator of sirC expression with transglutaminase-like and TPR domain
MNRLDDVSMLPTFIPNLAGAIAVVMGTIVFTVTANAAEDPTLWLSRARTALQSNDLMQIKLAVDKILDPSIDTEPVRLEIEEIAASVRTMVPESTPPSVKLKVLQKVLYEDGPWNGYKAFKYDMNDPSGIVPENRRMKHYLESRQGNCVTMPLLLLFVGERIGLDMQLAEAPLHLFVEYRDEYGATWNLEATSGAGFTRDVWYRTHLPMSDLAVANGVYLRGLSVDESKAVVASALIEDQLRKGSFELAVEISDVVLSYYPRFAYGLVKRGSAYGALLHRELAGKFKYVSDIPPDLKAKSDHWYSENQRSFAEAELLGWRPEDGQIQ